MGDLEQYDFFATQTRWQNRIEDSSGNIEHTAGGDHAMVKMSFRTKLMAPRVNEPRPPRYGPANEDERKSFEEKVGEK